VGEVASPRSQVERLPGWLAEAHLPKLLIS